MVRRGQGSDAATKAKKNDGKKLLKWSVRVGLVALVALTIMLVVPMPSIGSANESPSQTPTAQTTTSEATQADEVAQAAADLKKARQCYKGAVYYRAKADKYNHLLFHHHVSGGHRKLKFTKNVKYECQRAVTWKKRAIALEKAWIRYENSTKPCVRAGFPRWYCPVLMRAAHHKGVPSWARDPSLAWVISHESGFNPRADNPSSTAYGLFQMLTERSADPYQQSLNGLRYIKGRYGSPENAKAFWRIHSWY